jgi:broad specificity phosphatase PhoE
MKTGFSLLAKKNVRFSHFHPLTSLMKEVYLIRHAEGLHNRGLYHLVDPELTSRGEKQGHQVGQILGKLDFDHIIVSPLKRTLQTATLIFGPRPMKSTELVREYLQEPCGLRSKTSVIRENFPHVDVSDLEEMDPNLNIDSPDDLVFSDSEGSEQQYEAFFSRESSHHLRKRCLQTVEYLRNLDGDKIAIVSHGSFINCLMKLLKNQSICLRNCQFVTTRL